MLIVLIKKSIISKYLQFDILENHLTHDVEYEMKIDQIGIDNLQQFGDFRSIQNGAAPSKPVINKVKKLVKSLKKKTISALYPPPY